MLGMGLQTTILSTFLCTFYFLSCNVLKLYHRCTKSCFGFFFFTFSLLDQTDLDQLFLILSGSFQNKKLCFIGQALVLSNLKNCIYFFFNYLFYLFLNLIS